MIQIQIDPRRVQKKLENLEKGMSRAHVASAINASLRSTRVYASRLARLLVNWKAKEIYKDVSRNNKGDRILIYSASGTGKLAGSLYMTSSQQNIMEFGARRAAKGAVVTIWRGLGRQQYPRAWQQKYDPGPWFERVGKERLPFRSIKGPSMAEVLAPATEQMIDFASRRMEIEYQRKLRGILARA